MNKLILIHGALGSVQEFQSISPLLKDKFDCVVYEIPHHGVKQDSEVPFTMEALIQDFIQFLEKEGSSYVYGFSLGGYIAISAALQTPDYFKGIITQGTKFNWNPEEARKEAQNLSVEAISTSESFYQHLLSLHGSYLEKLLAKTAEFMLDLGENPILSVESVRNCKVPIRITRGGKDKMVTKEESSAIANALENGLYFEIPHMIHPLSFISPKYIAKLIETQTESFNYQWISTSKGKMSYRQYGEIKNDAPILLFLHEAIGSINQWQDFPSNLCQEMNLAGIAIEFPGYGFSEAEEKVRDERYLHEFALDYLPEFIENLPFANPLIIIGHSDGGTNALLYSSKYPERVKGIVTMAAHYINEPETRAGIQPAIDAYEAGKLKGLEFFHGEKTERLFYAWAHTWNLPGFKDWDISEDIKGNATPALILQGDDDQYGTDNQVNDIVELLTNAEPLFIKNCGHAPHLEQQREVIEAIKNWYEKSKI